MRERERNRDREKRNRETEREKAFREWSEMRCSLLLLFRSLWTSRQVRARD